jgi:3',5'-cyclic-AMP phosphodiesterase
MTRERFVIAQLSDIHFGDARFDPALVDRLLGKVDEAQPDLVLIPGDLTGAGYAEEYEQAKEFVDRLPCAWHAVPGNHDERNVGWRLYEELFGKRWQSRDVPFGVPSTGRSCEKMRLVSCDSAEPDLDTGELGRVRHTWIREAFEDAGDSFRVVMMHHHLVAVPNTGRERNTLNDAGDVLEVLTDCRVDLVVAGHKHVPYVWEVNGVPIVISGTATTWRIRGQVPPSFNILEVTRDRIIAKVMWTAGDREPIEFEVPRRP